MRGHRFAHAAPVSYTMTMNKRSSETITRRRACVTHGHETYPGLDNDVWIPCLARCFHGHAAFNQVQLACNVMVLQCCRHLWPARSRYKRIGNTHITHHKFVSFRFKTNPYRRWIKYWQRWEFKRPSLQNTPSKYQSSSSWAQCLLLLLASTNT